MLLDNMYNQLQTVKLTIVIEPHVPPVPSITIAHKIVIAEDLISLDSIPSSTLDTFVTLSDQDGHRVAKTRTICEALNPQGMCPSCVRRGMVDRLIFISGEETFDIPVEKPLWLMVSVRDRALVGKHDTVWKECICPDPKKFGDFLVHDLWLNLDTIGRILLRVTMEGEKIDLQSYIGSAFHSLT